MSGLVLGKPTVKPSNVSPTAGAPAAPATSGSPAAGSFPSPGSPLGPGKTNNLTLPPLPASLNRQKPVANILIVGESGSGKTRSLKDLNWSSGSIAFIDTECKGFEWQHLIPDDCYFPCRTFEEVMQVIKHVEANPKFTMGVVDSFTGFNARTFDSCNSKFSGFDIYSQTNLHSIRFVEACKSTRVRWIVTAIPEILSTESTGNTVGVVIKRAAVIGRAIEGKVESYFSYAVFLKVIASPGKKSEHYYVLQTDGKTQAKIPEGVTTEVQIENSMAKLLGIIEKAESGK
jgi:hypothetical protein